MKERIRAKALLGLPLTQRERAMFLLYIATESELKYFLEKEKSLWRKKSLMKKNAQVLAMLL